MNTNIEQIQRDIHESVNVALEKRNLGHRPKILPLALLAIVGMTVMANKGMSHVRALSELSVDTAMVYDLTEKPVVTSPTPAVAPSISVAKPVQKKLSALQRRHARALKRWMALGRSPADFHGAAPEPLRTIINPHNKMGVFMTQTSMGRDKFLQSTMTALHAAEGRAIVFDAKGSYVYFDAESPIAEDLGLEKRAYDLQTILAALQAQGIYTIARFIAVKDAGLTQRLPETRVRDPHTNRVISHDWIDPTNERALAYNMEVLCNLAKLGVNEINLDYIRFSTAEFGALLVYSGEEKSQRVEVFIKRARETIDRCNPETKLGLSTYAILGWNYEKNVETLGQDVVRFAPYVDVISPMAYPATFAVGAYYSPGKDPVSRMYYLVYRTLLGYKELLGPEHEGKLRPWIQGYGVTEKNMIDQMRAVYDAGSCGFTVWNASNEYGVTYRAMKKAPRPENCNL